MEKTVVAIGWLQYGFEQSFLYQEKPSGIDSDAIYDLNCVSLEVPEKLREKAQNTSAHEVIVRGKFLSDIAGDIVFLGLCNKTGIQVDQLDLADE